MGDFSVSFMHACIATGLTHRQIAPQIGVSTRTLSRWTVGESSPSNDARDAVVRWLKTLENNPHAVDALAVLSVFPPPTPPAPPAPAPIAPVPAPRTLSPEEAAIAKRTLEHALLLAAEQHDVAPRAARRIAIAVLGAIVEKDVPARVAMELVTPGE